MGEQIDERTLTNVIVWDAVLKPLGYEQVTVTVATGLTVPAGTRVALIQSQGQDVRWRDDGTSPSATVGMIIFAGESLWYNGDFAAFEGIEALVGGKLNVSYYGQGA